MNSETKEIPMENHSLAVYQPRFTDAQKTKIKGIVRLPDGKILEMEGLKADRRSAFIQDVLSQYTEAEIESFTEREKKFLAQKEKIAAQATEDMRLMEEREITFQAKAKALELPEVINCPDKRVGRKIRKSKSAFEVAGWLAVAFVKSLEAEGPAESSEASEAAPKS
ncbi:MAG: hypothetical protein EOP11_06310 [Proteobacteria bacterium]|nr:MAG: hypothetical protein EOP11_06310 [Pseudomonadota bacterium]